MKNKVNLFEQLARLKDAKEKAPLESTWLHNRTGNIYQVTGFSTFVDDSDLLVQYVPMGGTNNFSRRLSEFLDGRFTRQH